MSEAPPFDRTVCACAACASGCTAQPGYLVPGDLERIMVSLGPLVAADAYFWRSPGAVVAVGDRHFSIGTITPRMDGGRCVFLNNDGRCRVHGVAPFGCAFFDAHMTLGEAQDRSAWGLLQIVRSPEYAAARAALPAAASWRPLGYGDAVSGDAAAGRPRRGRG